MDKLRRILQTWIPLAALAIVLVGFSFVLVQQVLRQNANDPQVQLAHDTASLLISAGLTVDPRNGVVDVAHSLAPFIQTYDESGTLTYSSGKLDGQAPMAPIGVLQSSRASGENRVTWQPQPGVRIAAVGVRVPKDGAGYVLAGRSLAEVESRINNMQKLAEAALVLILVGILAVVAFCELVLVPR